MDDLPTAAQPTWAAYQAMAITKQRHLDYLQWLEDKYQKYGQPSSAEQDTLNQLLQQHDSQVTAFKTALSQLRISDPSAYGVLLKHLTADV